MKMQTKITFTVFMALSFLLVQFINEPLKAITAETKTIAPTPAVDTNQSKQTQNKTSRHSGIEEKKTSFTKALTAKGPDLRFDMHGKFSNGDLEQGHIEVFDLSKSKRIQKIVINDNYADAHFAWPIGSFAFNDHEIQMVDMNFDGYLDLRLLDNEGATGNNWYATHLYNPSLKRFVYHRQLSSLSGVVLDPDSRQIITYNREAWCAEYIESYRIAKDRLVLVKAEWTEMDRTRDEEAGGQPACFKYTGTPRSSNVKIDLNKVLSYEKKSYMRRKMTNIKEELLQGSLDGRRRGPLGNIF